MKKIPAIALLFATAATIFTLMTCETPQPITNTGGAVKGYVFTEVFARDKEVRKEIFLPGVNVSVQDSAGKAVFTTQTELDGSYATSILKQGKYQVCLSKTGFTNICYPVTVDQLSNHPGALKINLGNNDYIFGTVLLKDSVPAFYRSEVFQQDIFTEVFLDKDPAKEKCNVFGEYVLTKTSGKAQVTAISQNAMVTKNIPSTNQVNLTLPNSIPRIRAIAAFNSAGSSIMRTKPNEIITLKAEVVDPEGHPLTYQWVPFGDFPGSVFPNSNTATLQLPNQPGRCVVYLLVTDKFGAYAYQAFDIVSADEKVLFSGTVKEIDGSGIIAGANISINGQSAAVSGASGTFQVSIPQVAGNRYVLNVEKAGYALCSKIFFNDAPNRDYFLVKSTMEEFDPTTDIVITEKQDKYTIFDNNKFNRPGAIVKIPKNAIVDSSGKAVSATVLVSLRAIDLSDRRGLMPGDFGALQNGEQKSLESFGAIDVQIRDKANPITKYRLNGTALAEISIPLPFTIVSSAPASTVLWDYDELDGVWKEVGTLKKAGNFYVGKTNRFSVLNADVAFNDATCLRLLDDPQNPLFPSLLSSDVIDVVLTVPTSTGIPKIVRYDNLTAADLPLVIVRLPANVDVAFQVLKNGLEIVLAGVGSIIGNQIVRTGNPILGPANVNPPFPYSDCKDVYLLPTVTGLGNFNPNTFLSKNGTILSSAADALKYYQLIGAMNTAVVPAPNFDFTQWKINNNIQSGNEDFRAVYFNAGDLGFWRGMHQKSNGSNLAYYVSNFSNDVDAQNNVNQIATVAMEYSPLPSGGPPVTKFLVFNNFGQLQDNADLDGFTAKYIPGLCITCHGGQNLNWSSYANSTNLAADYPLGSANIPKFLPFDVKSFIYSAQPGYTKNDMQVPIRNLNEKVLSTNETVAIREFITSSYGTPFGNNTLNNVPYDESATVNDWNVSVPVPAKGNVVPKDLYLNVVGTSCRTCHIARTNTNLWFNDQAKFDFFGFATCGTSKYMPNAKQTMINFWYSRNPENPVEISRWLSGLPTPPPTYCQ